MVEQLPARPLHLVGEGVEQTRRAESKVGCCACLSAERAPSRPPGSEPLQAENSWAPAVSSGSCSGDGVRGGLLGADLGNVRTTAPSLPDNGLWYCECCALAGMRDPVLPWLEGEEKASEQIDTRCELPGARSCRDRCVRSV